MATTLTGTKLLHLADRIVHIDSEINQDDFAGYLCRRLPDDQLRFWDSHLEGCSRCRAAVAELKAIDDDAVAHSSSRDRREGR